ncbi:OmpA family protein [Undibacterium pigrum]|uniref:Outer membrane protein OmpA-like peptidoglycan-associated protein n=1 Tax=Undibacterium pigrum TaxID=401470 RepID=A0A318J826_9BURK|nr:OmpA family protein [Undibacterium pigrum]PXX44041.1 outer membrane protein OmpA-like peptidoglycan-associated protein [Undibacterium pigrum]
MNKKIFAPVVLMTAMLLSACSTAPKTTSLLDQTRMDYQAAQNNPNVQTLAPLEMRQADVAMNDANKAAKDNESSEKIDRLAYIAKQKIGVAQELAKQKQAEAAIADAAKARDQIRLEQRTNEADKAKMQADQAKAQADQARLAAQIAQGEASEAQRKAQEEQAKALEMQNRNAALEAQLADLQAKTTVRGIVITLGDVLFGVDQAKLNPDGMRTVQKLATVLQSNMQRTVLIEGHTDNTGSQAHNQDLSERRAAAVRSALVLMGVSRDRVEIKGYGEAFPVAENNNAQNRQLNRRVEIILSDVNGKITPR